MAARTLAALSSYDAVLTPTLATPPLPVGAIRDDDDPAADFEAQKRFTPYTSMWNVTGSPAISLPTHQTPDGLPVGVMLATAPGDEATLLSLAARWSRRPTGWTGPRLCGDVPADGAAAAPVDAAFPARNPSSTSSCAA